MNNSRQPQPSSKILKAMLEVWDETQQQNQFPISGESMRPWFRPGDQAMIQHGATNLRRGDVVVFHRQNHLTIHRIVYITPQAEGTMLVTKGDNLTYFDAPIRSDQLLGRVIAIQRDGREINIDTTKWRLIGRLTVVLTLGWRKLYEISRSIKVYLFGIKPNRVTGFLRETAFKIFSRIRRLIQ